MGAGETRMIVKRSFRRKRVFLSICNSPYAPWRGWVHGYAKEWFR